LRATIILFLLLLPVNAYATLSSHYSLVYSQGDFYEDGEKSSTMHTLNQTYYFALERPYTPALSYRLSLSTTFQDHENVSNGVKSERSLKSIQPALDIYLVNPFYTLNGNFRLVETQDERDGVQTNTTSNYIYWRLDTFLGKWPSPYLEFSRSNTDDTTITNYLIGTNYYYVWRQFTTNINLSFERTTTKTPGGVVESQEHTGYYNISYQTRYNKSFWKNRGNVNVSYQATFEQSQDTITFSSPGEAVLVRKALNGLHGQGTEIWPSENVTLQFMFNLVNNNKEASTGIDIGDDSGGGARFHNIGVEVQATDSVDRLYIYVKPNGPMDLTGDTNLSLPANWLVYSSKDTTVTGDPVPPPTWTSIPISAVNIKETDSVNNIYRYELIFNSPQGGNHFYKAVNRQNVNVTGSPPNTSVFVTEIEALGTVDVSSSGEITGDSNVVVQNLVVGAGYRARPNLRLGLSYSLNRFDGNASSAFSSVSNFFSSNLIAKTGLPETASIQRSYGVSAAWRPLAYLGTNFQVGRSETFDGLGVDNSTNFYSLGFVSNPIPTVNAHLTLRRSENFSDSEKTGTDHTLIFNLDTQLYKDIHMITDYQYLKHKNENTGADTTSQTLSGNIDTRITNTLFAYINYGVSQDEDVSQTIKTKQASVNVTYRPARFFNVNSNFRVTKGDLVSSKAAAVSVNWLALPVLRVSVGYSHNSDDIADSTIDTVGGTALLNLSRRINLRVSASHSETRDDEGTTESNTITFNLSGIIL
jgi:hypothetical protein